MTRPVWAIGGTFDVANYGDLLFPLLLQRDLDGRADVVPWSPRGGRSVVDALESCSLEAALARRGVEPIERVVIGGGNIVHSEPETAVYGSAVPTAYADIWYGALCVAHEAGVPLVWNAPGVPTSFAPVAARRVAEVARRSAYVSVRDETSRTHLAAAGVDADVHVLPDPAWAVRDLWTHVELRDAYAARVGERAAERVAVFHTGPLRAVESPAAIAESVAAIARQLDVTPLLLSIGACHGDGPFLEEIARHLRADAGLDPIVVVDAEPVPLRDVAACLAASAAYIGASMHGAITTMAFGRPALIVAARGGTKMPALCKAVGEPKIWATRWEQAARRTALLDEGVGERVTAVADDFRAKLDQHRAALRDPAARIVDGDRPVRPGDDSEWVRELLSVSLDQLRNYRRKTRDVERWSLEERLRLVGERDVQRHVALAHHREVIELRARIAALVRERNSGGASSGPG